MQSPINMKFLIQVRKEDGTEEARTVEAPSRFAVYAQVEKDGGSVLSLKEAKASGFLSFSIGGLRKKKIKVEERITFTRNLASMLTAGLTLSRALSVIERQSKNKALKAVVVDLEDKIRSGTSLHEALEAHSKIFPRLFIAMTKAGEEGGKLSETLAIVATQMERSNALIKKVKGAMIYPAIILVAICIIAVLMMIFVVPTLAATFKQFNSALPLPTQIIINVSGFMTHNIIVTLLAIILVVGAGVAFFRSKPGLKFTLFAALHMPVIGELVQETFSARATRTLSSLLSSGVEMLTALSITQEVVGDNVFGKVVGEAEESVRKGEALSVSFEKYPKLYPIFVGDMVSVGEETGKVSEMLSQIAEYYEADVEARTKDLSTIIEPVLMLFIGVAVGIFAVAMIAPIYSLSAAIS